MVAVDRPTAVGRHVADRYRRAAAQTGIVGRRTAALMATLAAVSLAACGPSPGHSATQETRPPRTTTSEPAVTGSTITPSSSGREGVPAFSHLFVAVMENEDAQGALAVPVIASLAHRYASATAWYAPSHPSLPNYLAMISGSTWGVQSDCTSCLQPGPDLGSQLTRAGVSWGAYMEGLPHACFLGPQSPDGSYAAKHDPFVYFHDVRDEPSLCAHVQPLRTLIPLLAPSAPATDVPRFVWVTPNLCHSGHDCGAAAGGAWLGGFVSTVTASAAWRNGGALIVTWDEGTDDQGLDPATGAVTASGGGGAVLTLVIAPDVPAGRQVHKPLDHYSLLRTVEDAFGIPLLGQAAGAATTPMSAFWSASPGPS